MKKRTLVFSLLMVGIMATAFAAKVEIDQAKQVGLNFYYERININQQVAFEALNITSEITVAENGIPLYYIFNIGARGYIIITADDCVFPVIGYSFETNWSNENLPPHVSFWINGYQEDILLALAEGFEADATITGAWSRYSSETPVELTEGSILEVEPLITDIWDQDFPYNAMCPEDPAATGSYNGRVPVGCVATAMSQVMHYWRFPETGTGQHCIYPIQPEYGQQCANFGATTYDWNGMTDNPTKECNPVAVLAYHCGISVDMQYGPSGSGTFTSKVANALKNYFNYSSSVTYVQRMSYSATAWANMIKGDLDQGLVIEYSGSGADGGHAWICDGYQDPDYFHMNWGWGGSYNGYFYLTNLNPGGSSFNGSQTMVYHIEPNPSAYPPYCSGNKELTVNDYGSIEDGSGPLDDYQNNANCSWLIAPDDGVETVDLDFLRFDLAAGDELKVYDGNSDSAPLIGTYSGNTLPPLITTTGPEMFVTFTSNSSGTAPGFLAEYDCNLINFCQSSNNMTGPTGDLSDGSDTYEYRNGTLCKWYIRPDNAETVTLDFSFFNTEETNDKIQVYDLVSGDLLGTFSGNLNPPPTDITASSGEMLVMWSTNKTVRGEGWDASYTITVATEEPAAVEDLRVYPNPVRDLLHVSFDATKAGQTEIALFSLRGDNLFTNSLPANAGAITRTIDLSHLSQGVYMLRITSNLGVSHTKVVVQ